VGRSAAAPGSTRWIWLEVASVFGLVTLATASLDQLHRVPLLRDHVHLLVGLLFLITAVRLAQREPDGLRRHGIDLAGLLVPPDAPPATAPGVLRDLLQALRDAIPIGLREAAVGIGVACIVFPPFTLAFYLWHAPPHPFTLHWPQDPGALLATQLLVVGLPEEALFRGYVQTRLGDALPARSRVLGVRCSLAALGVQAALFALIHFLMDFHLARLSVFFPALLFGWLRDWRGGIGAAVVLHAASNLLSETLVRGWL
jgi:membrane protease YdiL (CAAX protease family)